MICVQNGMSPYTLSTMLSPLGRTMHGDLLGIHMKACPFPIVLFPQDIAAGAVEVFVCLVFGGHQVVAVGDTVKTQRLTEPGEFHHLVHFHKRQ